MFPSARILFLALALLGTFAQPGLAETTDDPAVNPLRLSYINGRVSFWRYGAEDWAEARINTPLAQGDALYVGDNSDLELQAENRSFIRADDDTQFSIVDQTSDYLQLKVTTGRVSFDMRSLPAASYTVEIDTPNSVYTIDRPGYYRIDVDRDVHFITRRGGQATVIPAGGEVMRIQPSEEIVVQGTDVARAETYAAPDLDDWDRWNYNRTNDLADAISERYLPPGVAGASDLDHYGNWRVIDEYGPVWVPDDMPAGWVPYSSGRWIWDPYYQWTWIDDAPWGWVPFHYGRWICRDNYWMWAPGAVRVRRPVYAPALVGFYGSPPVRSGVSVSVGSTLGWVALSWGEPVVPWWGRQGFIGRPWWGGWGGPRLINNQVVRQTNITNITQINYVNSRVTNNAVVTAPAERFGTASIREVHNRPAKPRDLVQMQGALPVKPNPASAIAGAPKGIQPPPQIVSRPVVAVRRPPETRLPWQLNAPAAPLANERIVKPQTATQEDVRRPQFGTQTGPERSRPPLPPRYDRHPRQAESLAGPASPAPTAPNDVRVVPAPNAASNNPGNGETILRSPIRPNPQGITPDTDRQSSTRKGDDGPHQVVVPPPAPGPSSETRTLSAPQGDDSSRNRQAPAVNSEPPRQERPSSQETSRPQPWKGDNRPHQVIVTPPTAPSPAPEVRTFSAPAVQQPPSQHIDTAPPMERPRERTDRPERNREELPGKPANRVFRPPPQSDK